jgi:hypothetical protein
LLALLEVLPGPLRADELPGAAALERRFLDDTRPLVARYCAECHGKELPEAELDLTAFAALADVRKSPRVWQKVAEMLDSGQMPPRDSVQPDDAERERLRRWVRDYLRAEAQSRAGDPGPYQLRRLNNAEYTYTVRDLTGVGTLDPAREFPVDGAAGEGFTNAGSALAVSPALVAKYFDAAKQIAGHAVLLPDGFRFSPHTTRRDWTEEYLTRIRAFYGKFSDDRGGQAVNLQGIQFETNQGGRLPVERYLAATLAARDDLRAGRITLEEAARRRQLNPRYFGLLWETLNGDGERSLYLDRFRARWRSAGVDDAPQLAAEIAAWQQALFKFNSIGHIGKHLGRKDGPQSWMEAVSPWAPRYGVRLKAAPPAGAAEITLHLAVSDAGDGNAGDVVVWENPRFVAAGRPDLLLRDVRAAAQLLAQHRDSVIGAAAPCLAAAAEALSTETAGTPPAEERGEHDGEAAIARLAKKHGVEPRVLAAWFDYLGVGGSPAKIDGYLVEKLERAENYDFVKGWHGADALSVIANSSDQHVRVPGNMKPHGVAVHPAPRRRVIVGWRSPVAETLSLRGVVQHAHPECGNGVAWTLELRRGKVRQRLAAGVAQGAGEKRFGPLDGVAVRPGDVVALIVAPRDGNHSCDLTAVDLTLTGREQSWDLARELSPDILAGNPHADAQGRAGVWHLFSEPDDGSVESSIPAGSILARWQTAASGAERTKLADELQRLLARRGEGPAAGTPDAELLRQLTSLSGPLLATFRTALLADAEAVAEAARSGTFGLDPAQFGRDPSGSGLTVSGASLSVKAPSTLTTRIPADLVEGCEFVAGGVLAGSGAEEQAGRASVKMLAAWDLPDGWADAPQIPVVVREEGAARRRFETAFEDLRHLFPAALCYTRIVPVDEVVTLTLYYREDEPLRRLMLDEAQTAELDRLWDEMLYVAQEPLLLASAFEQLYEYATQDRSDLVKVFDTMREPVQARARAFERRQRETEPAHLDALLEFADRAYRRPLEEGERAQIRALYEQLRQEEIPHDEAFRLTLARLFVAPAFLFHLETPGPGAAPAPLSDFEIANRLSYFLWSSLPDESLLQAAARGELQKPEELERQVRRMTADPRIRRFAVEFGGQWLHVYNFDQHDEKSERHFPTFAGLRSAMQEEGVQTLIDLVQRDGSIFELIDADHTFLNEELARHYEIPGVEGPQWRRVDGVKRHGRGGILTWASTLSKQSGASRTSPILRGNWISEVLLGERLPRPPKNVPVLPETAPAGLTERQLIERHSSEPACAKCHARIDPLGFALENYDAIGRYRSVDAAGLPVNAKTMLADGTALDGLDGLRRHLAVVRRDAFAAQFYRKLLGYALGRTLQLADEPLLEQMQADGKRNGDRVQAALNAIVRSPQFRQVRGRAQRDPVEE